MYEAFFGFSQRPFAVAPQAKWFFPAASIDAARQTLARCIERSEGVGLLIGAAGTGKTLLLQVLAEQFAEKLAVVPLTAGQLETRRELLQAIFFELDLPYQGLEEGELRLTLVDHLTRSDKAPDGLLLLVDEAQMLSVSLLEELRMMTNLARDGEPRVRLVLGGNLELEELLAAPQLQAFSQRLAARCYLEAFDRSETCDYIRFQVAVAGGQVERVFEPEAMDTVHRATDGIPRLVNQLCDHALLQASANDQRPVNAAAIEEAWADLQQLPTPWQNESPQDATSESTESVIEFGSLEDDEAPPSEAPPEASQEHIELDFMSAWEETLNRDGPAEADPSDDPPAHEAVRAARRDLAPGDYHVVQDDEELQVVVDPYAGLKEPEDDEETPEPQPSEVRITERCEDAAIDDVAEDAPAEFMEEASSSPREDQTLILGSSADHVIGDEIEAAAQELANTLSATEVEAAATDPGDLMEEEIVSDRYAELDNRFSKNQTIALPGLDSPEDDASQGITPDPTAAAPDDSESRISLSEAMRRRVQAETAAAVARALAESDDDPSLAELDAANDPPSFESPQRNGTMVVDPRELLPREAEATSVAAKEEVQLAHHDQLAQQLCDMLDAAHLEPSRSDEMAPPSAGSDSSDDPPPRTIALGADEPTRDDIVVLDDDETEDAEDMVRVPDEPAQRVKRQDYKSLFARLRPQ